MATSVAFGGKLVKLPGAYATIVSGEQAQPITTDYGRCLLIDTGVIGAGWGGGSGISGDLADGKNSVYRFDNLADAQKFIKGGLFWKAAERAFRPDPLTGAIGVSELLYVRAAATTSATLTFTATGGGANGGTFKLKTRDEGVVANGVLTSTHLDKGYAYTIVTGTIDPTKWVMKIWRGTWTGDHTDGVAINEIPKASTVAELVVQSPEFNNIATLISWATSSAELNVYFKLDATSAVAGTGVVDAADIALITGYQLASGGTETYSSTHLDSVLEALTEEDFSFVLMDRYGTSGYTHADLTKFISFNLTEAKFKHFLFVGGGNGPDQFSATNGSLDIGAYFNSAYVHVVHSDIEESTLSLGEGFRRWPSIIHAAQAIGRVAGKEPQIPATNKTMGIDKLVHVLSKKEKERALDAGVMVTVKNESTGRNVILQAVNTLQDNTRVQTPSGQSHQVSTMRIFEQLNKELIVNAETTILNDENGGSAGSVTKNQLRDFTETYLESRTSTAVTTNLIISYSDVSVSRVSDSWRVDYKVQPNSEVNKIFFTGYSVTK